MVADNFEWLVVLAQESWMLINARSRYPPAGLLMESDSKPQDFMSPGGYFSR
jgi:hypothetical protein